MSFTLELTDEQQDLRERAHRFAQEVIRPNATEYDRAQEFPLPVLQEAARAGFYDWQLYATLTTDPTGLSLAVVMEELFWGCAGIGLSIVMPALALAAIRQAATDEQLARWAPECFGTPDDIKLAALAVTDELALPLRAVGCLAAAAGVSREEVVVITQCASPGKSSSPLSPVTRTPSRDFARAYA